MAANGNPAASAGSATEPWADEARISAAVDELLPRKDLENVTIRKFRRQVASHLGLGKKGLEDKADACNILIKQAIAKLGQTPDTPAQRIAKLVDELGAETKQVVVFKPVQRDHKIVWEIISGWSSVPAFAPLPS